MMLIKKIVAGSLLTLGSVCLIAAAYAPFDSEIDHQEKVSEVAACLVFGLPLVGVGGWMGWQISEQVKKAERDRLLSIFYQLLKQENGRMNALQFAMAAQITATAAQHYLNEQAKALNADFEVSDEGNIFYHFALGGSNAPELENG